MADNSMMFPVSFLRDVSKGTLSSFYFAIQGLVNIVARMEFGFSIRAHISGPFGCLHLGPYWCPHLGSLLVPTSGALLDACIWVPIGVHIWVPMGAHIKGHCGCPLWEEINMNMTLGKCI